jgi:hypothetical protein
VVPAVISCPGQRRVLKGGRAEREQKTTQQRMRFVRLVGKQTVIARRQGEDREAGPQQRQQAG